MQAAGRHRASAEPESRRTRSRNRDLADDPDRGGKGMAGATRRRSSKRSCGARLNRSRPTGGFLGEAIAGPAPLGRVRRLPHSRGEGVVRRARGDGCARGHSVVSGVEQAVIALAQMQNMDMLAHRELAARPVEHAPGCHCARTLGGVSAVEAIVSASTTGPMVRTLGRSLKCWCSI